MSSETPNPATAAEGSSTPTRRVSEETVRPDPGPLPAKQGEIGYVEPVEATEGNTSTQTETTLPTRHPADRDASQSSQPSPAPTTASLSPSTATTAGSQPPTPSSASPPPAGSTKAKKSRFHKKLPGGLLLSSFLSIIIQFIVLAGTITAWVLVVKTLNKSSTSDTSNDNQDPDNGGQGFGNSTIFVHVLFVVASLGQLLFIERRIWRLRAERYIHLHPGEVLPSSHRRGWMGGNPTTIAFSPWNRPPLPAYAAALRESGSGTGDVEDNLIAVPPPPAYGNTRGSRLLLTGFLRESLRAQRPASVHSEMSQRDLEAGTRPVSYQSKDEEWEVIQDADRAMRLEETLARLERPTSRD